MATVIECIELHSTHGGSDKVYNIQVCETGDGFVVNYQNGRRGGTLAMGTKTKSPVTLERATTIYEKLIREKINGNSHYVVVGADGSSASSVVPERTASGFLPMLPSVVAEADVEQFIVREGIWMQPKLDGERVLLIVQADGQVTASNKLGFLRPVPAVLSDTLRASSLPADTVYDGELVGETFHAFDVLRLRGEDCLHWPYHLRKRGLELTGWGNCFHQVMRSVETFRGSEKRERFTQLHGSGAEGVIFRDASSPYVVGSTVHCLKYKFTESATLLVNGHEPDKRSVYLGGFDGSGQRITMGKVTIPPNRPIPDVNDIIEVQYLYAYPGSHALAQPIYKGVRTDQAADSCVLSQLKYKVGNVEDGNTPAD